MDLYLALDRQLLGRLALFGPLSCYLQVRRAGGWAGA